MRGMKRFKKTMFSLFLAAAMIMGEAGAVLAAEPKQAGADVKLSVQDSYGENGTENHNVDMNMASNVAVVEDLDVEYVTMRYTSLSGYLSIVSLAYGGKFDIYVNGKLFKQQIDTSATVSNPAPYNRISVRFDNIFYNGTYKIDIIPYTYTEAGYVAGTAVSKTISIPDFNAEHMQYSKMTTNLGNGYNKPDGVKIRFNCDIWIDGSFVEIQRKEGNSAWKTIAKVSAREYIDKTVSFGKTYQYRIRAASGKNDYGEVSPGQWFYVKDVKNTVPNTYIFLSYKGKDSGVSIDINSLADSGDAISGYVIYRSTKETTGYKKVATLSGASYVDKNAKKGTYYYKARAYYYDTSTGKIYYGTYSEPKCIKLILDSIYVNAKQTGSSQVTLEWNEIKDVSEYEVWYKSDIKGDAFKLYKSTKGTKLKVSGLLNNTNYTFTVRAKKNGSAYYSSNDCSYRLGFKMASPYVAKSKVVSNKAKTAVAVKSTIKWDRVYGAKEIRIIGITYGHYENRIYIPLQEKVLKTLAGSATSYTLTTKQTAKSSGYDQIQVVVVNGKDEFTSNVYGFKNLNETSKLIVKRAGNKGSIIGWKAVSGATSYTVYRQSPYGYRERIGTTDKCTYKDLNVTPGVTYTYSIVANNDVLKLYSDEYGNVTKAYTHKLGTPKIISATNTAKNTVTIKWSKVSYADRYVVYRATSKNGKYKKLATVSKSKTSYIDKKVVKGKNYYYKVRAAAKNAAGLNVLSKVSTYKAVRIKK